MGNLTRKEDTSWKTVFCCNQEVSPLSSYTYDALYRVVRATGRQLAGLQGPPDGTTLRFLEEHFIPFCPPDPKDKKLESYTETYRYDDGGNLVETRHTASQSWTRSSPVEPSSNRLAQASYDRNGNMDGLDHLRSLVWNYRNNLAQVDVVVRQEGTNDGEYYLYDGGGNRILKVAERVKTVTGGELTETEETLYLGNYQVKRIRKRSASSTWTILDRGSLSVMDGRTRVCIIHSWPLDASHREVKQAGERRFRYQLGDALGSVALEVDEQGRRITYEEYFPYGGTAFIAGDDAIEVSLQQYRYSGKENDTMTGLYDYGARYYPPWMGRWLNPDPAGTVDGLNLYAFVGGNPVSYLDVGGTVKKKAQYRPPYGRYTHRAMDVAGPMVDWTGLGWGTAGFATSVPPAGTQAIGALAIPTGFYAAAIGARDFWRASQASGEATTFMAGHPSLGPPVWNLYHRGSDRAIRQRVGGGSGVAIGAAGAVLGLLSIILTGGTGALVVGGMALGAAFLSLGTNWFKTFRKTIQRREIKRSLAEILIRGLDRLHRRAELDPYEDYILSRLHPEAVMNLRAWREKGRLKPEFAASYIKEYDLLPPSHISAMARDALLLARSPEDQAAVVELAAMFGANVEQVRGPMPYPRV